jgi:hypothetical protein
MNKIFLLCLIFSTAAPILADRSYYDQQEEIRRAAERLVEHDKQQREAAARRYDQRHRSSSSISTNSDFFLMKVIFLGVFWLVVIYFVGGVLWIVGKVAVEFIAEEVALLFAGKKDSAESKPSPENSVEAKPAYKPQGIHCMSKKELKRYRKNMGRAALRKL